jgi:dTDP-4-dehydrorhamnose reductase
MLSKLDLASLSPLPPPTGELALWGGVECTINRIGDRYLDQIALSGHDARADDLDRFADLGLTALRYPLLWESFAGAADREALWAWHDRRLDRLRQRGVRPILGLIHHGSGPAGTSLLDSGFADGLARHAALAAARYPWVRDWSPVNEPLTTARFSALYGHWYPHRQDEAAFWLALLNQADGVRAAMAAIRAVNPAARLIQTEDIGFTSATAVLAEQAEYNNLRRWGSWDLLTGRLDREHPFWDRLAEMGFADRLQGFVDAPCPPDVLGLNHYLTSDRFLDHRLEAYAADSQGESFFGPLVDVEAVRAIDHSPGLGGALRDCWERYRLPIAVTEVHNGCTREEQMRWFQEAWDTALQLRDGGLRIEAVTAWSLLGAFDWDSLLTRNQGHYESGVFDLRTMPPRATALAPMIRALAAGRVPDHPVLAGTGWWRRGAGAVLGEAADGRRRDARPILIVGASGTLGQAFAGACRLRDIDYVLSGRDTIDLRDPVTMARELDRVRPWAVINCAGWVRVDEAEHHARECLAANFAGSVDLGAACGERDIHYTCFSSDLVFDGQSGRAYVESDAMAPLSVYGASKARADEVLGRATGRCLTVRTASFFSPFDPHNFAMHLVAALRSRLPFRAAADCVTSPTYMPDLVRATLDLIIDDERGLWHLANDGAMSWAEFAGAIAGAMALPVGLIEARPAFEMGWVATRPVFAPLTSERGLIMPSLASAVERFAVEANRMSTGSQVPPLAA